MNFETCGPFEFTISKVKNERWRCDFWAQLADYWPAPGDIKDAIGCYSFCLNNGKTLTPWYVGKTIASFEREIFTPHKIAHYTNIKDGRNGRCVMFLFPLMTDGNKYSAAGKSRSKVIGWLEKTLIGMALSKNPSIANTMNTKYNREVWVNGLLGGNLPGRPHQAASAVRKAFIGRK